VALVTQGIFSYFRTVLFTIVSERGMADLRKDLYNKIISQSVTFFEERRVGELTSRITADVEQLQSAFSVTLAEFLRQVVTLIAGIAIIAYMTPRLSLIMLLTFPVIVISAMIFGRYIRRLSKKRQDQLAETNTIVEETLQSFQVVKSFQDGTMAAGDLFSFIIYTGVLGGAIASFGTLYSTLASAVGATERVQGILDSTPEVEIGDSYQRRPENSPRRTEWKWKVNDRILAYGVLSIR